MSHPVRLARGAGIAALAIVLIVGLLTPPEANCCPDRPVAQGGGDRELFRAVADRIGHGEGYYAAMGAELVSRSYPTGHVYNWRTPLYLELAGGAPRLLTGLIWLLCGLVVAGTAHVSGRGWLVALPLQIGGAAAAWAADSARFSEALAGLLIALSVLASLRQWRTASIGVGMAALFVRELAAPYVGIRLALALWRREWRDAAGWALGLGAYLAFYAWHASRVYAAMPAVPAVYAFSHVHFGGLRFILATLRTNGWLIVSPWWVAPFALVALLAAMWRAPVVVALPILGYLAVFAFVGLPFNWYWGLIPGMLMPLAWSRTISTDRLPRLKHDPISGSRLSVVR